MAATTSGSTPELSPPTPTESGKTESWIRDLIIAAIFVAAVMLGWVFWQPIANRLTPFFAPPPSRGEPLYWVSPMDSKVRFDHPGKDSMGMEFIPVYADEPPPPQPTTIKPELQERDYTTAVVTQGPLLHTVDTISTIAYAEPNIGDVTLKMDAWLEHLSVDYVGESVKKGDALFDVYAPDLVTAQEEYLLALEALDDVSQTGNRRAIQQARENVASVPDKLRYLDVADSEIERLQTERKPQKTIRFYSPFSGIVIEKQAYAGKFFPAGQLLYRIADLSTVWVYLHIYPPQIHCVYVGQSATLTLPEFPDHKFAGKVVYIYPLLEPKTRTVKVRLEFQNPDLLLKPDMFGRVLLEPHHKGIGLRIPESAVLKTGKRELVYLVRPGNHFEARDIQTGMPLDDGLVEVLSGVSAGDVVVASENFISDSESRLRLLDRKFAPVTLPESPSPKDHVHQHQGH